MVVRLGRRLWRTIKYWNEIDGNLLAAAVSFYASLAAFPLILVLLSTFGFFLSFSGSGQDVKTKLIEYVANQSSDQLASQIEQLLGQIQTGAKLSAPLGLLILLVLSVTLFLNFERAFAKIWNTKREPGGVLVSIKRILFLRLRAFLMLLGVAVIITLNFAMNFAIAIVAEFVGEFKFSQGWWQTVQMSASTLLNAFLFTIIYQTLPKVPVRWYRAVQGGLFAAVTWELGRQLLAMFVISDKYNAFGVVGAFMGLLLWTFYGSAVILLGGTFVRVAEPIAADLIKSGLTETDDTESVDHSPVNHQESREDISKRSKDEPSNDRASESDIEEA